MTELDTLADLVGPHRFSTDPADLMRHSSDWSPAAFIRRRNGDDADLPACVVRPDATAQVAAIVRWAASTRTAVVAFGGGSGVLEAIRPAGAVVVDLRALDQVVDIDEKSRLVRVQAGVTGVALAQALRSWRLTLGHEPQSLELSTVGGWVSTRATGQLSGRYGGIEDLVAALEVVLPDGTVARTKPSPRRASGPDIASLVIGAEGTLGIVTEVTLRVVPVPQGRTDVCIRFDHMSDGVTACRALAQSDLVPTVLRLYDREDAALFLRSHPEESHEPLLILSFDGSDHAARAARADELCGGRPGDAALVEHWWKGRNDVVHEYAALMEGSGVLGPHAVTESIEVSGTWSVLRDLYHGMKEALTPAADLVACHLSHVYPDGACLYFILASSSDDDAAARATHEHWWDTAMSACLNAGGSISHHHGIGRVKAPWLRDELGEWWDVLALVKRALDPHNIMNPGAFGL